MPYQQLHCIHEKQVCNSFSCLEAPYTILKNSSSFSKSIFLVMYKHPNPWILHVPDIIRIKILMQDVLVSCFFIMFYYKCILCPCMSVLHVFFIFLLAPLIFLTAYMADYLHAMLHVLCKCLI